MRVPAILILTMLALLLAHVPAVQRLGGARMIGLFAAYLFIAVIGASCDFEALAGLGRTGGLLVLFVALVLLVHGLVQFGAGRLLRLSPETLAIGTYAGFLMVRWLQSAPSPMSDAHAIPPPPTQSVADCDRTTYASDQLVCTDPDLLALDRKLGDLLAAAASSGQIAAVSLVEPQEAWFKRRSLCSFSERHAACLKAAYSERIAVISVVDKASPEVRRSAQLATCRKAPWGSSDVLIGRGADGLMAVLDAQARVLAVAFASPAAADWSPFVRFTADGATVRFTALDGTTAECRMRPGT